MSDSPRVLVVSPRFPLPLHSGTQLRIYHSLTALAEQFDVTLVSLLQASEGRNHMEELESMDVEVQTVQHARTKAATLLRYGLTNRPYRTLKFITPKFRSKVQNVLDANTFDLVVVHFLTTMSVLPDDVSCPVVLDQHNADIKYWESFLDGTLLDRAFAHVNQAKLRRFRTQYAPMVDAILSVSEGDAEATREWIDCPVWMVPNGVDTDVFSPTTSADEAGNIVTFVGSLDVRMNVEALTWFVNSAWPLILETCPDAVFRIVGRNPTKQITKLDDIPGVTVIGTVPDVVPYYDETGIVVAPFRYGGGTKLKILETLSMERALVTTPIGATGINIVDGEHGIVRERGEGFARGVVKLLENPSLRTQLGENARELAYKKYAWSTIMDQTIENIRDQFL